MHKPLVSVILPAYNAEDYIEDAIRSVLKQTTDSFELIIVNDGSSDKTVELVGSLMTQDARISLINTENQGIVSALNLGLDRARGQFIARMDADDVCHPLRFERQLKAFVDEPQLIACGSFARAVGAKSRRMRMPKADNACLSALLFYPCFIHPTVMFRATKQTSELRYREEFKYAEDYDFWLQLAKHGRLRNLPVELLRYRFHENQTSEVRKKVQREIHLKICLDQINRKNMDIGIYDLRRFLWPEEFVSGGKLSLLLNTISIGRKLVKARASSSFVLVKSVAKIVLAK